MERYESQFVQIIIANDLIHVITTIKEEKFKLADVKSYQYYEYENGPNSAEKCFDDSHLVLEGELNWSSE